MNHLSEGPACLSVRLEEEPLPPLLLLLWACMLVLFKEDGEEKQ